MMKIFQSTLNTRPVLENSIRYIRSDIPTEVSENEKNWLLSNNVTTIIDLRTDEERARKQCPLIHDSRFAYHVFDLTGGNSVPAHADDVSKSYIGMVDEKFHELIAFLLSAKSNVLYFCNAGKDRTGVVSAVLLHQLGISPDYIVQDYLKSNENLEEMLKEYARQNPDVAIDVITPRRRYIEGFLKWYIDSERNENRL